MRDKSAEKREKKKKTEETTVVQETQSEVDHNSSVLRIAHVMTCSRMWGTHSRMRIW